MWLDLLKLGMSWAVRNVFTGVFISQVIKLRNQYFCRHEGINLSSTFYHTYTCSYQKRTYQSTVRLNYQVCQSPKTSSPLPWALIRIPSYMYMWLFLSTSRSLRLTYRVWCWKTKGLLIHMLSCVELLVHFIKIGWLHPTSSRLN